jgi:hypothetical protein
MHLPEEMRDATKTFARDSWFRQKFKSDTFQILIWCANRYTASYDELFEVIKYAKWMIYINLKRHLFSTFLWIFCIKI